MKNLEELKQKIRTVSDFPKPGISFKDLFPVLMEDFTGLIEAMAMRISDWDSVDYIIGIESRGFILASGLAGKLGKGFVPVRKKGKLPPPVHQKAYALEYGEDCLEIAQEIPPSRVVIVDDVIATGGTLLATMDLCRESKLDIRACLTVINLEKLNDVAKNSDVPIHWLFNF